MSVKKVVKKSAPRKSNREASNDRDNNGVSRDRGRDSRDNHNNQGDSSRDEKGSFVNITKLFETKKNPDNLVGTCKPEYLDALSDLIAEAKDKDLGVAFFVFLQGKWGPSLAATVAQPQEDRGSFNDGNRGGSRSRSSNRDNRDRGRW